MNDGKAAKQELVNLKRVSKGKETHEKKFEFKHALEILRGAAKMNVPTWQLADSDYKFEANELIKNTGPGLNQKS